MRKLAYILLLSLVGCSSGKKIERSMDFWMGSDKSELIMKWGPPSSVISDGSGGDILVYAERKYSVVFGGVVDYWLYRMFYAHADGKLYHWFWRKDANPPDRIDVRLFVFSR